MGGGLQVASSLISDATFRKYFDHIIISEELALFSNISISPQITITRKFAYFELLRFVFKFRKRNTILLYSVFGPTYILKFLLFSRFKHIVGFASPRLIDCNNDPFPSMASKLKIKIQKLAYKLEADALICEHEYMLNQLSWFKGKCYYANNGAHQSLISKATHDRRKINISDVIFGLYVSSGYKHKNHEFLIKLAYALETLGIKIKFHITVDDTYYKHLKKLDKSNCLINLGPLKTYQLAEYYIKSDIVVIPSLLEASSACIYEAIEFNKITFAFNFLFNTSVGGCSIHYIDHKDPLNAAKTIFSVISSGININETYSKLERKNIKYKNNYNVRVRKILSILNHTLSNEDSNT